LSAIILLATIFLAAYLLQESVSIKEISRNDINRISLLESTSNAFRLLRDRNMLFLLVGATIHQWGMRLVFPFLSLYANTVLGFSLVMTGLLLNARTIGDVAGQLPIGKLIDRFGGEFALFLHVFLTAPIIYFYTLTNDFFLIFIIFLIWGSEAGWDMPSRRLLIIKFSKGVGTATALGYIQAFIGFVSLPAPTIGGWIWDKFNPTTVFQVGAIVNVFGCIPLLILLLKAKREKRSLAS
jgi:predicted MFS family arabinose efflux permease